MFKKIYIIIFLFSMIFKVFSQEIEFKQFFAAPTTLSPPNTGEFNGNHRIGVLYGSNWGSIVNTSLINNSFYYDTKIKGRDYKYGNWHGVGLNVASNMSSLGSNVFLKTGISYAYHKSLDNFQKSRMTIGFGLNYFQNSLNYNELNFGSQFNGIEFDKNINSFESFNTNSVNGLDISAGLKYSYRFSLSSYYNIGWTINHINKPINSFVDDRLKYNIQNKLYFLSRFNLIDFLIEPAALCNIESNDFKLNFGSNIIFSRNGQGLYSGIWYEFKGNTSALIGFVHESMRFLALYKINTTKLNLASNYRGGFEISLTYIIQDKLRKIGKIDCPSF